MKVITINREYGAGGHSIGMLLSKKLGIPFYDKDLVKIVASEAGFIPEDIEKEEHHTKMDKFMDFLAPTAFNDQKMIIHEYQLRTIIELAKKGPCIILGRCADVILADAGIETFNVFLYADDIAKVKRTMEIMGTDDMGKANKEMKRMDAARKAYYLHYTGKNWGETHNYNMTIDTGATGYEKAADIIAAAVRN